MREASAPARLEVARALSQLPDPRFRALLVPLMFDAVVDVAREAIRSAGKTGRDSLFVPPLVSLMRNRVLKPQARDVLVGYGEEIVDALAYFLRDNDEDIRVRRHIPSVLGRVPSQRALDVLAEALHADDELLRFRAGTAIERIRRTRPDLRVDATAIERAILQEALRAFSALTLHHNLVVAGGQDASSLLARALAEKHQRARSRIFRLLGMVHPPDDIAAVRSALEQPDARLRSGAVEYLDNLLGGDVRRRVMMLVDEMPAAERVRRGNVLFKTRVRDVEDTLAQLVHDDEAVIAAAAIQAVERRALWTLAGDLEHIVAHRDPRDWAVFEAASWALAARRMSTERRRVLWLEPLPAVELVDRLRGIRLFEFASVDELFDIGAAGKQVRHEAGRTLYEAGRPPDTLQVLLDGRVVVDAERARTIEAPAVLAFEEVIEGRPLDATIRAAEPCITLSLTTEEFLSLLSENIEIAQGIFRRLIETDGGIDDPLADSRADRRRPWQSVLRGELPPELRQRAGTGLQAVDLVLLLQSTPLLARATASQLLAVAGTARPIRLKLGTDPLMSMEPSIVAIVSGAVHVERDPHPPDPAGPGDVIGVAETLGGAARASRAEVIEEGAAVRFARSDLFDLLADHIDLLQAIFSALRLAGARSGQAGQPGDPVSTSA